jgi:hypothetical protein
MKRQLLSLIGAIITIGFFCSSADAQPYTLNQYFPLGQGNALLFAETGEENKTLALQAVLGLEVVGIIPTQTTWYWSSTSLLARKSSSLAWNLVQGLGRHKDTYFQGLEATGYTLYDSPDILLPRSMATGAIFERSSSYTRYDATDTEVATGTIEREVTLVGVEEVTVRAGSFTECLKFSETVSWEEDQNNYGSWEKTFWLAPGIGPVKWDQAVSETIAGQEESMMESSWELLLGYVGGEPILPGESPEAATALPGCGMGW